MSTPLLNARVPHDVLDALDAMAAAQGTSRSDQVRMALSAWVSDHDGATQVDVDALMTLATARLSLAEVEAAMAKAEAIVRNLSTKVAS